MKYDLVEKEGKLILDVTLFPYKVKGTIRREQFDINSALSILKENNYFDYVPENKNKLCLDNKFTSNVGTYVFVKKVKPLQKKPEPELEMKTLTSKETELTNNNVDTPDKPVLQYSKKRKRRKSYSTDE
jgi:hypothetical protein